jgi:hypothetical protein
VAIYDFMETYRDTEGRRRPQIVVADWNFYPGREEPHDFLVGALAVDGMRGDLTEAFQPNNTWPTWEPLTTRPDRMYYRQASELGLPPLFLRPPCAPPTKDASCPRWPPPSVTELSDALRNLSQFEPAYKLLAPDVHRAGFTSAPGDHGAVASDHLAVSLIF